MITSGKYLLVEIIENVQGGLGGSNNMMGDEEAIRETLKETIIEEIRQTFEANGKLPKADEVSILGDDGVQKSFVGDVAVREVAEEILGEICSKCQTIIDELTGMCV